MNHKTKLATLIRRRLGALCAISTVLFTACVQEAQNNQGSAPNPVAPPPPTTNVVVPAISIDSPLNNSVVAGTVTITATTTGYANAVNVQYQLDETNFGSAQTQPPYSLAWNTTEYTNRSYRLSAIASDMAGNSVRSTTITFTVNNLYDTQSPTAPTQVTATPASASQINLAWNAASDNIGVAGYRVYRNGTNIATAGTPSYADASVAPSSQYSYTVTAYDAAGNESPQSAPPVLATTPSSDPTPPTVSFTNPSNNSSVANSVLVTASASDNVGVVGVQFKLDNSNLGVEVTSPPYSVAWNTKSVTTPSHTLTAVARDAAGNSASATITVTVANPVLDTTAPGAPTNLTATPASASQINLAWSAATDNVAVTGYKVYRTGAGLPLATTTTTSFSNTGLTSSAQYSYAVTAIDAAGNESLSSIAASASTPSSDPTPPTVSFASPTNNAVVFGTVTIAASASDNVGVVGVQFKLDNSNLGAEITNGLYNYAWDTTAVSSGNGLHTLIAVARDAAGNSSSATLTITVSNPVADIQAPTTPTTLTATPLSSSQINLAWGASTDNVGVSGYKIYRNGSLIATTAATNYSNTGLIASTSYSYTVAAYDAASNLSGQTSAVQATTLAGSTKKSYSTNFDGSEHPISEGGAWSHNGLDWAMIQTGGGIAYGTQTGSNGSGYDDSYATLSGFAPDQTASAVIQLANISGDKCSYEAELHLRWSDSAHIAKGYEVVTSYTGSYVQIVRWNGAYADFAYLPTTGIQQYPGLKNGDVFSAKIVGNVITAYVNGSLVAQATDSSPITTGNPGIGFFRRTVPALDCQTVSNSAFGFTSFTATDN